MENILITGGAGYIGSTLANELVSLGYRVVVVDNFLYGQTSLNHLCAYENFTVYRQDVRNTDSLRSLISDADIIIPLAGIVGAPACERDPYSATSINKTAVFDMLKHVGSHQLILMPTTNSAYGHGDADNHCDELSPLNPISLYARDKVEIEKRLMQHPCSVSLRLATVFGMSPRMRLDLLVNDFVWRAVNDKFVVLFEGHFKRNYIHIRDVVDAFVFCIKHREKMQGNIYNVGLSDANISKIELCEKIKQYIPSFRYYVDDINKDPDQRNYIVSNQKIESLGFAPRRSLDVGIQELLKGYSMLSNNKFSNIK